jgi:Ca-activated chloride channel family protein
MLAQDVLGESSPDRLGRARDALIDFASAVQERGGHRLGLVVFASRARLLCPLTHDYDYFRETIAGLEPDAAFLNIGPNSAVASGTRLGAALRAAVEVQDPRFPGQEDILLLSDGDDPANDGEWQAGALLARQAGIPVHDVGIGDPDKASPITLPNGATLKHEGQPVLTRLHERPLEDIARLTGGVYVPARKKALPLGKLFRERIEPLLGHEEAETVLASYEQHASWFFAGALLCLVADWILGDRRRQQARHVAPEQTIGGALS